MKKRILSALLVLIMIFTLIPTAIAVSAASTPAVGVTKTLNFVSLNQHDAGLGYTWNNSECKLTLNGINLSTSSEFGIVLPASSVIELKGDNYITTSAYGISSTGPITFIGNGTLTITCANVGITSTSAFDRDAVIFRQGTVKINGAKTGVHTEKAKVVVTGGNLYVTATESSIFANYLQLVGGSAELNGAVKVKNTLEVKAMNAKISAPENAISAKSITVSESVIKTGAALTSLADADEYKGEAAVEFTSTHKFTKKGALFGGKLPLFVDYVVFALIIIAVAAVIIVPIIIKRKRTAKLMESSSLNKK